MSSSKNTIQPLDPDRFKRRKEILGTSGVEGPAVPDREAFIQATEARDLDHLERLLRTSRYAEWCGIPDFIARFAVNENGDNLLHLFAAKDLFVVFPLLQKLGEYVNSGTPYSAYRGALCAQNVRGETPLHTAVIHDNINMVKAIYSLAWRDRINVSPDGETVQAEYLADWGTLDDEWRLPLSEFVSIKDSEGRTALEEAQARSYVEIIAWLQQIGEAQGVI